MLVSRLFLFLSTIFLFSVAFEIVLITLGIKRLSYRIRTNHCFAYLSFIYEFFDCNARRRCVDRNEAVLMSHSGFGLSGGKHIWKARVLPIDLGPVDINYGNTGSTEAALCASFYTCPHELDDIYGLRIRPGLVLGFCKHRRECFLRRPSWGTLC